MQPQTTADGSGGMPPLPPKLDLGSAADKDERKDWEFALSEFGERAHIVFMRWLPVVPAEDGSGASGKEKLRLLIITPYRVAVAKKAAFGGVAKRKLVYPHAHLFDLVEVQSPSAETAGLRFTRWSVAFHATGLGDEIVHLLQRLLVRITAHFPNDFVPSFAVLPAGRLLQLNVTYGRDEGFLETYRAAVDACSGPQARPSAAFMHHINAFACLPTGLGRDSTSANDTEPSFELLLHECAGIEAGAAHSFELAPIALALRHTTLFRSWELRDVRRRENAIALLADAVATCPVLQRLVVSGTGCSSGFEELGYALKTNRSLKISFLDLSGNDIQHKGASNIAGGLAVMRSGLRVLRLSKAQLSSASVAEICEALRANPKGVGHTLEELDLSHNDLREEGSTALSVWIASLTSGSSLRRLDVAHTKLDALPVLQEIEHRLSKQLTWLSLAGNNLTEIAMKGNSALEKFLMATSTLKALDMTACELTEDGIDHTLGSVVRNDRLRGVSLLLSGNSFGSRSSVSIAETLRGPHEKPCIVKSIHRVDLSDSRLGDKGLPALLHGLIGSNLRYLDIGGEQKLSPRGKRDVGEAAASLLTESAIETLILKNLGLGAALAPLFAALCESKLRYLDVTSNSMGDATAFSLAACLSENPPLRALRYDDNNLTIASWQALRSAVESNSTISDIAPPNQDVEKAVRSASNKDATRAKIQELVTAMLDRAHANHSRGLRRAKRRP